MLRNICDAPSPVTRPSNHYRLPGSVALRTIDKDIGGDIGNLVDHILHFTLRTVMTFFSAGAFALFLLPAVPTGACNNGGTFERFLSRGTSRPPLAPTPIPYSPTSINTISCIQAGIFVARMVAEHLACCHHLPYARQDHGHNARHKRRHI